MKEVCWRDCIDTISAKKVSPDVQRAHSLVETAKDRVSLIKEINERNCNFVFEDYYTSLLELLQAMTFKKGYNVLNHICLGFYLRDVLNREDLFFLFDDLRYKINSLNYYGRKMDFVTATQAIEKCKRIITFCENDL